MIVDSAEATVARILATGRLPKQARTSTLTSKTTRTERLAAGFVNELFYFFVV
jgi:hypothetical protein